MMTEAAATRTDIRDLTTDLRSDLAELKSSLNRLTWLIDINFVLTVAVAWRVFTM